MWTFACLSCSLLSLVPVTITVLVVVAVIKTSLFRLLSESLFLFPDGTTAVENVRSAGALEAGMVGYWDTGFSTKLIVKSCTRT